MTREYTEEDKRRFASFGKDVSSAAVMFAAIHCVENSCATEEEQEELINLLRSHITTQVQSLCLEVEEVKAELRIFLDIVDRDYRTTIDIHESYARDLFENYNLVKNIAIIYWAAFKQEHSIIVDKLQKICPDTEFELKIDPANPTTLYFDPLSKKRIGIKAMYVKKGRGMIKK